MLLSRADVDVDLCEGVVERDGVVAGRFTDEYVLCTECCLHGVGV